MNTDIVSNKLFKEISQLIESTKAQVAQKVNSSLVLLYWKIGRQINHEILAEQRAEYGKAVITQLATQLAKGYGKGFDRPSLFGNSQNVALHQI